MKLMFKADRSSVSYLEKSNREISGLCNEISHLALQLRQNINQSLQSQKKVHISPSRTSYDVFIVKILDKFTVGERTVTLKIIARCSITQTPTGQWIIDNVADQSGS